MKDALEEIRRRIGKKINSIVTKELVIGVSYTGVRISSDDVGLANTPLSEFSYESCNIFSSAGTLTNPTTHELAKLAQSWDLSERVVGVAAVNALSQLAIRTNGADIVTKSGDAIDLAKIEKEDTVVMIGNMRPSVQKLRERAKKVLVLERSVGLRDKDTFPDTAAETVIPRGDIVFLTGATLCNGTTDRILELSRGAREVVMLGASAGVFPPTLFERGVTSVGSLAIQDPGKVMKSISEGGGGFAVLKSARYVVHMPKIKKKK